MQATLSMPLMPSKTRPPSGGVARVAHDVTIAPIRSDDFGEIIDNGQAVSRTRSLLWRIICLLNAQHSLLDELSRD
jgi:hypothetical protein